MSLHIIDFNNVSIEHNNDTHQRFEASHPFQHEIQESKSYMHRSAPNVKDLNMNNLYFNDENDFIFNSCQQRQDYEFCFQQEDQQFSYEEDQVHLHYQEKDIFDKIQHFSFDYVNRSILQEESQSSQLQSQLGNQQNILFDNAFEFNIKLSSNQSKISTIGDYHTDRVVISSTYANSGRRSLQKNKPNSKLHNEKLGNSYFPQFEIDEDGDISNLMLFKKKNQNSNKKKYQPFTSFAKQSNILAQISPSNNLNESQLNERSVVCSLNECEKSIFGDHYLGTHENKEKLLKKIDKLVGSKIKSRKNQILEKKIVSKQRRQLKTKKNLCSQVNKENFITHIKKQSLTGHVSNEKMKQNIKKKSSGMKMFKRSSTLAQHIAPSQQKHEKQLEMNSQINNKFKNQEFSHIQMNQSFLFHLSQKLSPQICQHLIQLNQIYNFSSNQSSKTESDSSNPFQLSQQPKFQTSNVLAFENEMNSQLQKLEKQEKQMNLMKENLIQRFQCLKKILSFQKSFSDIESIDFSIDQQNHQKCSGSTLNLEKQDHKDSPFIAITNRRQQIMSNFDLWNEINF